jgi:hypothetical protein
LEQLLPSLDRDPLEPSLGLLPSLLARLRAEQPESNCFMCLTSDDPRDWCAEHLTRLDTVSAYGEAA